MAIAQAGAALRWGLLATVRSPAALLLLQPLHALSFSLMWVASLAFVKERAPKGALATAQGLFTASAALGAVAGMPAWGALYRRAGGAATFWAAALLAACACALALALGRRREPRSIS
jgi:PPP family 3-phenylpropionic acid transporter